MNLHLSKGAFVSTLTLLGLRAFGLKSLEWDPLALRDCFEEKYGIQKLSQKQFDKLNCGYTLVGTNAYTSTIEGFLSANAIMSGHALDSSEIPYNTIEMIAWGVWEYINLVGDIENSRPTEQFSPDIIVYIREAAKVEGLTKLPIWLDFVGSLTPDNADGDVALFEMYTKRQDNAYADINNYVSDRQTKLTLELDRLRRLKFL